MRTQPALLLLGALLFAPALSLPGRHSRIAGSEASGSPPKPSQSGV